MFKANVEVTKDTQQGWDNYKDIEVHQIKAKSIKKLKIKIDNLNKPSSYGDFGVCLSSTNVKVLEMWEVLSKEVKKPLDFDQL